MKNNFWTGLIAGSAVAVVALFLASFFSTPVVAENATGNNLVALSGNTSAQKQSALYVLDTGAKKIAVYMVNQRGVFNLQDVRNFKYDIQLDFWPYKKQSPTVEEMMKSGK